MNAMQRAIARKDLRSVFLNKQMRTALIVVPLVITIFVPSVFILASHFVPDQAGDMQQLFDMLPFEVQSGSMERLVMSLMINNVMPLFFTIIPVMASSIMAASSFVGEKEKKTLETLLYCPLTLRQIFQAKILASFVLSMIISFASFTAMMVVVQAEILFLTGGLLMPDVGWLIVMLIVAPAISWLAITLIVGGSAKSQTMEESQQRAVFLVLPTILLVVGQFAGIILISAWLLLGLGALFALIAYLISNRYMRRLTYETLLQ